MAVAKINGILKFSGSCSTIILDKGIVIDAWQLRVSLVGIELLAIEARVVTASVKTNLWKYGLRQNPLPQPRIISSYLSYANLGGNFAEISSKNLGYLNEYIPPRFPFF